jgi:hypothetical protein
MEKYCVSLEWAKKLVEAGIDIVSKYYWVEIMGDMELCCGVGYEDSIPAPIAEELLEILPEPIMMSKAKGVYGASYIAKQMTTIEEAEKTSGYGKTLKEALADLAIKLKEEGII